MSLGFIFGTYTLFLIGQGLSEFEANLVNTFFMLSVFLFEIPTGVVADVLGRKISTISGILFNILGSLFYFLGGRFLHFVLAEMTVAVGRCLISGAFEAWAYDSLNDAKKFAKVQSNSEVISQIGPILTAPIGGIVAKNYGLEYPFLMTSLCLVVVWFLAIFFMKRDRTLESTKSEQIELKGAQLFKNVTKDGIKLFFSNSTLIVISIAGALAAFAFQALNMFWALILNREYGFSTDKTGTFFSFMMITLAGGAYISRRLINLKLPNKIKLAGATWIIAVGIALTLIFNNVSIFITGFLMHEFARGLLIPLTSMLINKETPANIRATVISINSMILNLGAVLGLLVSGYLATEKSLSTAWFGSLIALTVGGMIYLLINSRGRQKEAYPRI